MDRQFQLGLTRICIYIYTYSCVSVYIYTLSISLQPLIRGSWFGCSFVLHLCLPVWHATCVNCPACIMTRLLCSVCVFSVACSGNSHEGHFPCGNEIYIDG